MRSEATIEKTVEVTVTLPVDLWTHVCQHAEIDQVSTSHLLIGAIEQFLRHKTVNTTLADLLEREYEEWLNNRDGTAPSDLCTRRRALIYRASELAFQPTRGNALNEDALANKEDNQHGQQDKNGDRHHIMVIGLPKLTAEHIEAHG